ncbi:MAG: flavin-dependent oxidoreductase [Bryobacterales bacterium]|nr:flavin-dependent oxidoreductase [Bryobacterales bacterium]
MQVLIAGGGIGGLAVALSMHRAGIACQVFEAAAEIRPLGVGINLLPHAVRELTLLGLDGVLAETGVATKDLSYYSKRGQLIWREPRGVEAGYAWPQYSIHRGRLQMRLLQAVRAELGADAVQTGHALARFDSGEDGVTAHFTNGASARADLLVGADGIHSAVRRTFYPHEGEPQFSGRLLWRGVSHARPFLSGRSMIMAGHANQKFVAYPIGPATINWVAELHVGGDRAPLPRDWNRRAEKASFLPAFQDWRFPWLDVPELVAQAAEVFEFPMVDRDPVPRWSFGCVTLLGDAAHPMYPVGSNGASQAILDAAALAQALTEHGVTEAALTAYEQARLAPTAAIVESNRRQGPEVVMQMAEDRAPAGFDDLERVIPRAELEQIAARYKQTAGFDKDTLNQRGAS